MDENRIKFVVGLGNPGRQYEGTRHNVGFRVLAELGRRWGLSSPRRAFGGDLCETRQGDQRVLLLAPLTYMNLSGQAVLEMLTFYKGLTQDLLVVLDDMALPVGQLRARAGGSSGGQKGLGDVLNRLGTQDVQRLRIGIGSPPPPMDAAAYVLTRFSAAELKLIEPAVELAAQAVDDWLGKGIGYVMERYNRKPSGPADKESDD